MVRDPQMHFFFGSSFFQFSKLRVTEQAQNNGKKRNKVYVQELRIHK